MYLKRLFAALMALALILGGAQAQEDIFAATPTPTASARQYWPVHCRIHLRDHQQRNAGRALCLPLPLGNDPWPAHNLL